MSIVKLAATIQGGAHSNKKSAWKHSKMLSGRADLPLAVGINKFAKTSLNGANKQMTLAQHEFWANRLCSLDPQTRNAVTNSLKKNVQPHDFNAIMDMHAEFSNYWKRRSGSL